MTLSGSTRAREGAWADRAGGGPPKAGLKRGARRALQRAVWWGVRVRGLHTHSAHTSSRVLAYAAGSARQLLISCATAFSFRENWSSGKSGIYDAAWRRWGRCMRRWGRCMGDTGG